MAEASNSKELPESDNSHKPIKTHKLHKRQPIKPELGDSVIYINSQSNIKALFDRCNKLITTNNEDKITIYCLGAAISKGILLSLQLRERHASFDIDTKTLTTELIDDLEPMVDDADYDTQHRFNSALQIQLVRIKSNPLLPDGASSTNNSNKKK